MPMQLVDSTPWMQWYGTLLCMNIVNLLMWIASFSLSYLNYFSPFIVGPGVRKYSPVMQEFRIAPQIICLGGCFIVVIVYFSSNLLHSGLLT